MIKPSLIQSGRSYQDSAGSIRRVDRIDGNVVYYTVIKSKRASAIGQQRSMSLAEFAKWAQEEVAQ